MLKYKLYINKLSKENPCNNIENKNYLLRH